MIKNLTTEEFKELVFDYTINDEWNYKGKKPAILDFWASWCQPCKMIAPVLEELSVEYPDIDFYKVDTEEQNELAYVFRIQSIPSILLIPINGQPQMALGALPKETLKQAIAQVLFPSTNGIEDAIEIKEDETEDKPDE